MAPILTFANQLIPPELLDLIITFIGPEYIYSFEDDSNTSVHGFHNVMQERQAVLHALCLTSRALYTHCLPFLYQRIQWIWEEPTPADAGPPLKFTLLLRTLLTRPDLVGLVQYIHLNHWNLARRFESLSLVRAHFTPHELAIFTTAVSHILGPQNDSTKYGEHELEVVAAVAMSLMQGLRSITLVGDSETDIHDGQMHPLHFWEKMGLALCDDSLRCHGNYSIPAEVAPVKMLAMLETLEIIHSIPASFTPSFCIPTLRNLKLATLRPTDLLNPDDGWELRFEPEEIEQLKACSERWGVTFSAQMRKQKAERLFRKAFGS